jgi:hypothetical protein
MSRVEIQEHISSKRLWTDGKNIAAQEAPTNDIYSWLGSAQFVAETPLMRHYSLQGYF